MWKHSSKVRFFQRSFLHSLCCMGVSISSRRVSVLIVSVLGTERSTIGASARLFLSCQVSPGDTPYVDHNIKTKEVWQRNMNFVASSLMAVSRKRRLVSWEYSEWMTSFRCMLYSLEKVLNEMEASCGSYVKHSDPAGSSWNKTNGKLNNLTLYKSRTEFMLITSGQRLNTFNRLQSFTIDSNSIKQAEFMKSFGAYRDENLTSNVHIEHISKKIASCIDILKTGRSSVPLKRSCASIML